MSASYGRMWASRHTLTVPGHGDVALRQYVFVRSIYNRHFAFCRTVYIDGAVMVTAADLTQDHRVIHVFDNFTPA